MSQIKHTLFKQYVGTLDQFKTYYAGLDEAQQSALSKSLIFIHDAAVDGNWNNDGYIFANGQYYTCRETNLTAETLKDLIASGSTDGAGVIVEVVEGRLVFTPCLKEELKALTNVGFVEKNKTWAAGTSIEDILNDIFAKEVWYKADFAYTENLSVSITKPTLTVTVDKVTAANSGTYEIGAPVVLTGSMTNTSATGNKFTLTCASALNGFITNGAAAKLKDGDSATGITSLEVDATLSNSGSDTLSVSNLGGVFANAAVSNNAVSLSGESVVVKSGTNKITLRTTSKTYTLTAKPSDDEKTLTTLSNKNKYYTATTKDDVAIKHTVTKTHSEAPTADSSISFTGAYKYYYVWSAASQPTIPTNFSGDLDGWTENWGTKTVNPTATAMNEIAWVLKPSGTAPTIVEPTTGAVTSFETVSTHTNKYGTSYTLYRFPKASAGSAGGANYKDMKLN